MVHQESNVKPLISIIIPCYNYSLYIPQALKSLQEQDFTNWECWVIDDGSTDSTSRIVNDIAIYDKRINYVYQENQGQPVARNTGLRLAKGDYIQFLDADDLLEPMKFSRQLNYLLQNTEVDIVYGAVGYFNNS